ncbi:SRPBCC domain-containing protein [bacterium]|nr:MAG: SRPBCC domain-containing protein [bacterium]
MKRLYRYVLLILTSIICLGNLFSFSCQQETKEIGMTDNQDQIIKVTTVLNSPIDTVFSYFSDNTLLSKWLTLKADVEMKVGGKYELFWTPEDPDPTNNSTYGCKVLAFERPYYLTVEWRGNADQKKFMNNVRPLTTVTLLFTSLSATKTKITLLHTGWHHGNEWEAARQYFTKAWSGAFKRLESIL